jgi:alcohol dehydrogenase (cytochrome c)
VGLPEHAERLVGLRRANEFVTFDMDGKRYGGKADRNGFFYVIDANNGKLQNAFPFVRKITWASGIDLKTGRPNFIPANRPAIRPRVKKARRAARCLPRRPSSARRTRCRWPTASRPAVLRARQRMGHGYLERTDQLQEGRRLPGRGLHHQAAERGLHRALRAVDPKSGKIVWEVKNNAPLWGGVMTTAGGLVFYGTPEGYLKALDAKSGKELWKFQTGSGVVAPPVTWQDGDTQYVAVVSGWGGAVPLWGGDVAKKVNFLEQGGSVGVQVGVEIIRLMCLLGGHGRLKNYKGDEHEKDDDAGRNRDGRKRTGSGFQGWRMECVAGRYCQCLLHAGVVQRRRGWRAGAGWQGPGLRWAG